MAGRELEETALGELRGTTPMRDVGEKEDFKEALPIIRELIAVEQGLVEEGKMSMRDSLGFIIAEMRKQGGEEVLRVADLMDEYLVRRRKIALNNVDDDAWAGPLGEISDIVTQEDISIPGNSLET